jgi:hypothetical protein
MSADEQRVINDTPITTLQQISNAPAIMASHNPTAKRSLKVTPCVYQRLTRNNTLGGGVPLLTQSKLARIIKGGQQRNSSHCHMDTVFHSKGACMVGLTANTNCDDNE